MSSGGERHPGNESTILDAVLQGHERRVREEVAALLQVETERLRAAICQQLRGLATLRSQELDGTDESRQSATKRSLNPGSSGICCEPGLAPLFPSEGRDGDEKSQTLATSSSPEVGGGGVLRCIETAAPSSEGQGCDANKALAFDADCLDDDDSHSCLKENLCDVGVPMEEHDDQGGYDTMADRSETHLESVAWSMSEENQRRRSTVLSVLERNAQRDSPLEVFDPFAVGTTTPLSPTYDVIVGVCIVLNAAFLGVQINLAIGQDSGREPLWVHVLSTLFTAIFFVDLVVRIASEGPRSFFTGPVKHLNMLDTLIVAIMLFELIEWAFGWGTNGAMLGSLSVLRVVRIARLARLARCVQLLRFFSELRVLMLAMAQSWRTLAWVFVIVGSTLYVAALVGATGAAGMDCGAEENASLCLHFGGMGRSFWSAFMAMHGGILWGDLVDALAVADPLIASLFTILLVFSFVVLANLVTGSIVEVVREAKSTEEQTVVQEEMERVAVHARALAGAFSEIDINRSGGLSKDELLLAAGDPRMAALLSSLKLDISDISTLFTLLDKDGKGAVNIDEFVKGCVSLTGEARRIHCQVLRTDMQNLEIRLKRLDKRLFPSSPPCRLSSGESEADADAHPHARQHTVRPLTPHLTDIFRDASRASIGNRREEFRIDRAELRAMSLEELKGVWLCVQARCRQEGWMDPITGKDIAPKDVTLYTFNYNHICPMGCQGWLALKGLVLDMVDAKAGMDVEQRCENGQWLLPRAVGIVIEGTQGADLLIEVKRGRFEGVASTDSRVFVNGIDCGVPTEVVPQCPMSYKELISNEPLAPEWFCSHWWGERIADFVHNCIEHAHYRGSSMQQMASSYWVCGYANRQYELSQDLDVDPENSSFNRAMTLAKGTLLQLDDMATPFSRIWCCFEVYRTLKTEKMLDMVTLVRRGSKSHTSILSDDTTPRESAFTKMQRESHFPIGLLVKGLRVCLEDGESTVENDKRRIMATISRMAGEEDQDDEEEKTKSSPSGSWTKIQGVLRKGGLRVGRRLPTQRPRSANATASAVIKPAELMDELLKMELERINSALRGHFARAAWPPAVKRHMVNDFDPEIAGSLRLPEILHSDLTLKRLTLSLAHITEVDDEALRALSRALPYNLQELCLSFEGCTHVGDVGVAALASRLPPGLRKLKLDFLGCRDVTDRSVKDIARFLPEGLVDFRLDCANCPLLTSIGVDALRTSLPSTLQECRATFIGTQIGRNYESVQELRGGFHPMPAVVGGFHPMPAVVGYSCSVSKW